MSAKARWALPFGDPTIFYEPGAKAVVETTLIKALDKPRLIKPESMLIPNVLSSWTIDSIMINGREHLDEPLTASEHFTSMEPRKHPWLDAIPQGSMFLVSGTHNFEMARPLYGMLFGIEIPTIADPLKFSGPIRFRDISSGDPIESDCYPTNERILPGHSRNFIARPNCAALRVRKIVIDLRPEQWAIEDITVEGKSQFHSNAGPVPGDIFSPTTLVSFTHLDTIRSGEEFAIQVAYQGPNPKGRFFGVTCYCQVMR